MIEDINNFWPNFVYKRWKQKEQHERHAKCTERNGKKPLARDSAGSGNGYQPKFSGSRNGTQLAHEIRLHMRSGYEQHKNSEIPEISGKFF